VAGEKILARRWPVPFNGGAAVWGRPHDGGGRGGLGAVLGQRCRSATARARRERAGDTCACARRQTGKAGLPTSWPRLQ
jgi:hypothetical protein